MIPFKLDQKFEPLEDWNSGRRRRDQLGRTDEGWRQGSLRIARRADPCGLYEATKGRFRVVYPYHEHSTVREGIIAITDESTGTTIEYGPGDSWIIAKNAPIIWTFVRTRFWSVSWGAMADID